MQTTYKTTKCGASLLNVLSPLFNKVCSENNNMMWNYCGAIGINSNIHRFRIANYHRNDLSLLLGRIQEIVNNLYPNYQWELSTGSDYVSNTTLAYSSERGFHHEIYIDLTFNNGDPTLYNNAYSINPQWAGDMEVDEDGNNIEIDNTDVELSNMFDALSIDNPTYNQHIIDMHNRIREVDFRL
tara:strand:- start:2877 stop:3428 length:552 start_codon:yes stop_codon:yes gene_type:complete